MRPGAPRGLAAGEPSAPSLKKGRPDRRLARAECQQLAVTALQTLQLRVVSSSSLLKSPSRCDSSSGSAAFYPCHCTARPPKASPLKTLGQSEPNLRKREPGQSWEKGSRVPFSEDWVLPIHDDDDDDDVYYSNGRRPREDEEGEESYDKRRQWPGRGG